MNDGIPAAEFETRFAGLRRVLSRETYLLELCAGRTVLHVGCVDAGLYGARRRDGGLLHAALGRVARRLIGVDVDSGGLDRMRRDGFRDLHEADVAVPADRVRLAESLRAAEPPDLVVCGEVIEHVDDTVALVRGLLDLSRNFRAEVVLTTPNPFYYGRFLRAALGSESVHPDHNAYLSLANLRTILRKAGGSQRFDAVAYVNLDGASGAGRIVKRAVTRACPYLSDGLIVRFRD